MDWWVQTYNRCNSLTSMGIIFHGWPDGASLLEQEHYVIEMFTLISDVVIELSGKK